MEKIEEYNINKVENLLEKIRKDIKFSKDVNMDLYGLSIDELMNSKSLPIRNYCLNFSLCVLNTFRKEGIKGKIILIFEKDKKHFHFMVSIYINGEKYYIDIIHGTIAFLKELQDTQKIIFESNIYNGENTIKELFANKKIFLVGLYFRKKYFDIIERKKFSEKKVKKTRERFFNGQLKKDIIINI